MKPALDTQALTLLLLMLPIAIFFGLLIASFFLRLSVRILEKFYLPWGSAMLTILLAGIVALILGLMYLFGMQFMGMNSIFVSTTVIVMDLVVCGWVYGMRIDAPGEGPIGIGRGTLVALVQRLFIAVFVFVIVFCIGLVAFAIGGADMFSRIQ